MRNLGWGLLLLGAIGATCDDEKLDATGGSGGSAAGGGGGSAGSAGSGGTGGGGVACGWEKRIGNGGYSSGRITAVTALSDGRLFVAGKASTERVALAPLYYALLEPDGSVVWEKTGTTAVEPAAVAEAGADGLLIAGTGGGDQACTNPQGGTDAVLWRIDRSTGAPTSKVCVGGTDDESAKAVRIGLEGVTVIGSSLSSDASGNVGESPNPGFQVSDLLIARFGELTYGELFGSAGPDAAAGFVADGAILGTTLGDDSGDLEGQPSLGYGDIWLIAPQIMKACGDGRCASDGRWGGTGSDNITATTESGYFVGATASRGPEYFCASQDGEPVAWVGHFFVTGSQGGFDRATCIDASDAQLLGVGARGGAVVAVGKGTKIGELEDAETPDGRTSGALLLAFDGQLTRTLALITGDEAADRFLGVDITEAGCIVAVGRRGDDGWIYTRPVP